MLYASLLDRQDAPDGGPHRIWVALALPLLWVVGRRRRVRMVALKAMALGPGLNAMFAPFRRRLRLYDPGFPDPRKLVR